MSLTIEEIKQLVHLLQKVEFPLPLEVFNAWCENFAVPCVEIALMREGVNGRELFLTHRVDEYYDGWHIPGAVIQAGENVEKVLRRIARDELQGLEFTPRFFSWVEYLKGKEAGESARGNAVSILFSAEAPETLRESDSAKFFSFSAMPSDLISEHVPVVETLRNM